MIPEQAVEKAAEAAYLNNRAGSTPWADISEQHKSDWRKKVQPVLSAAAPFMAAQWQPLTEFARWALTEGPLQGCDLDGGSVQDKAEALGLIIKTKYDPSIHGDSDCCEPGDDWFVLAPVIAD